MVCAELGIHRRSWTLSATRSTGARPFPPDSLCEAALAIFIHELDCRAVAVVDGAAATIGIILREAFMARMERTGAALASHPSRSPSQTRCWCEAGEPAGAVRRAHGR